MSDIKQQNVYYYFVKEYPKQTVAVIAAFICAAIAEMFGIGIVLPIITSVVSGNQGSGNLLTSYVQSVFSFFGLKNDLGIMLLFMVLVIMIKALIIFFAMKYVSFVATDISRKLRVNLIDALMHAKWSYYSSIPLGKISNMLSNEGQRAGNCYLLAGKTTSSMFQLSVYAFAAFLVSWKISIIAMCLGGTLVFSLKTIVRMARNSGQELSLSLNKLLSRMSDSLMLVKPIRAMGEEDRFVELLGRDTNEILNAQRKQYISNQLLQVVYEPVVVLLMSIGLYFMMTFSSMPVPEILLLAFLFHRLMNYASLSQNNYQNTVQNESAVWALINQTKEAVDNAERIYQGKSEDDISLNKKISVDKINFGYGGIDILRNFSCNIKAGKINLIFGPSGVGKSSLIDIITGMNSVEGGRVMIDDTDIREINAKLWRSKIGYVPQETILLHDSIKNNITLGSNGYNEDDISNVLKKCDLLEFINSLPEGVETSVGERGTALSGGQRQRIALARAIIREPAVLIMDEATTGLDKYSERLILNTVKELTGDMTVIMISHDPDIKELADNIIEMSRD